MYLHEIKSQPVTDLVNVICKKNTAKIYRGRFYLIMWIEKQSCEAVLYSSKFYLTVEKET